MKWRPIGLKPVTWMGCGLTPVKPWTGPFWKRIKNRIQACKPEALVLGETLCPLHEAVDVPVDMVYLHSW